MHVSFAVSLLIVCVGVFGCASASAVAPPPEPPAVGPPHRPAAAALGRGGGAAPVATATEPGPQQETARHVYRLDYVLEDGASGKGSSGRSYTMNLEEHRPGDLSIGSNVPLSPSNARQDVGLRIRASYVSIGDDLLLHSSLELSSAEDRGAIRKMTAQGEAVVAPGKRALVASLDDPGGQLHYQLFATATRLR